MMVTLIVAMTQMKAPQHVLNVFLILPIFCGKKVEEMYAEAKLIGFHALMGPAAFTKVVNVMVSVTAMIVLMSFCLCAQIVQQSLHVHL